MASAGKAPSLSPQGGFVWSSGEDSSVPPAFGRMLASGEREFLSTTGFSQRSYPPVIVVLHPPADATPSLPSLKVDALEGGLHRIRLDIRDWETSDETRQLLITSLMLREYYGDQSPVAGSRVPQFPPWVTRGMALLCFPPQEMVGIPSGYLNGGAPPTLEDFLIERPPERSSPSLCALYDAMSSLLLKAGLMSAEGQAAFRNWIGQDDPNQPDRLPGRWVSGWAMKPVERRWLLLMAGSSRAGEEGIKLQSVADSLKAYDEAMAEGVSAGATLSTLARDKKGGAYSLGKLAERLDALRLRANPMILPLLDRTLILLGRAPKLPEKKITAEETNLKDLRQAILKQSDAISAYLDWYEAAKLPVRSGVFDKFLRIREDVIKKGPIGRHVDAVETRGW